MKKFVIVASLLFPLAPLPVLAQTASPPTNSAAPTTAPAGQQLPPAVAQLGDAVSRQLNDSGLAAAATHNIPTDGQDVLQKWQAMQQWVVDEERQLDAAKKDRDDLQRRYDEAKQQLDAMHRGAAPSGPQSYPQTTPRR